MKRRIVHHRTVGETLYKWFGSRKFIAAGVAWFTGNYFLEVGKLTGSEWVTLTIFILGIFVTGEVVQKATTKTPGDENL